MKQARCPRCGAGATREQPDPLARCESCGALLASSGLAEAPRLARTRLDPQAARDRVHQVLLQTGHGAWRVGPAELVYYPFAADGPARAPYRPLAELPPLVAGRWKAAGADLVRDIPDDAGAGDSPATRIPVADPPPPGTPVVHYPFYRLPLENDSELTACWCDGVDRQVMLPEELRHTESTEQRQSLGKVQLITTAVGIGCGLVLPFPYSLLTLLGTGAFFWSKAGR